MDLKTKVTLPPPALERNILTLMAAWLSASAVMNFLNRNNKAYFSLRYAGLEGLPQLVFLTLLFSLLFFFLRKHCPKKDPNLDLSTRLLFFAWLLFASTLTLQMQGTLMTATLLLVVLVSLVLARGILTTALKERRLPDILLAVWGAALTLWVAAVTPWSTYIEKTFSPLPDYLTPGVILVALTGYLGIVLFLCHILKRFPRLLNTPRSTLVITLVAMGLQIWLISWITVARYEGLTTPTYDFNLFVQMFHYMAETLRPLTTLERNLLLSHFKVHVSPIYYLMLPFYMLFPDPATLQILQAIVVASGIIPLILLAKELTLSLRVQTAFSVIYLVSPALIVSNFYDLHENCFLAPLVLWLIYFLETKNNVGIALFTLLTLSIKEDAAIYIWTLASFFMLDRKMMKTGLAMFLVSGTWFIAAINWLSEYGDGAMTGRFDSLIGIKEWSLLAVPYSVFRNPGFVFSKLFAAEKLPYLFEMLGPLAFTPLFARKLSRWILLIPFLLMNIMVDYPYQYNIRFQYNYGSYVILLYMALLFFKDRKEPSGQAEALAAASPLPDTSAVHLEAGHREAATEEAPEGTSQGVPGKAQGSPEKTCDNRKDTPKQPPNHRGRSAAKRRNTALLVIAMTVGTLFSAFYITGYASYPRYVREEQATLQSIKEALDTIPQESSVIATTFLTGYLGQRETLYDLEYNLSGTEYYPADFVVIDLRPRYDAHRETAALFRNDGYRNFIERPGEVLILIAPWKDL